MENEKKDKQVKHKEVKKLTPDDLKKVSGGSVMYKDTRDCKSPDQPTCLAYIVVGP
jgi:hypothetical protein